MRDKVKPTNLATLLYGIMIAIMVFVVCFLIADKRSDSLVYDREQSRLNDVIFYDSGGEVIENTLHLDEYGPKGSIYTLIPEDIEEGYSLCFRAKHLYFNVTIDDTVLYSLENDNRLFYTKSNGVNWVTIPLETKYAGEKLIIEYEVAYENNGGFNRVCIDRASDYVLEVIKEKIPAVVMCLAYVVIGCMLIMINFVVRKFVKADRTMFWLGFMSLSIALYCLLETQILQLFFVDNRLIHLLVMFAMILIPIPAIMYSHSLLKVSSNNALTFIVGLSFGNFIVQTGMTWFGHLDYHDNILVQQILLIGAVITMFAWTIMYVVRNLRDDRKLNAFVKFMIVGLLFILVCGCMDVVRYWTGLGGDDPAKSIRFGFLGYLICFAFASSEKILNAFHNNLRLKMVSKLAYEDGLTNLYNRTSYQEMVTKIETEKIPTAVVMMDLNNLKFVNDTFGHDDGDEMLIYTATMLRQAFKPSGATLYRIGGDEFV